MVSTRPTPEYVAILLAAGRGSRFDALEGKLIEPIGEYGEMVAVLAAQALLPALPVVAVVAAEGVLADALRRAGCDVTLVDPSQRREMSATLRQGILHGGTCRGWLVALADMPLVAPATIVQVCNALRSGSDIAVPVTQGRRGHPVGFSARHRDALLGLRGDQGARAILAANPVTEVEVDDKGIHLDLDTRADLQAFERFK
jgi:molybdenum cofactor cytidylyltransferase